MSAYLPVALYGCGSIVEVQPLQDGILAESLLDVEHGLLQLPLALQRSFPGLALPFLLLVIGKEVQLYRSPLLLQKHFAIFVNHIIGGEIEPAHQKMGVGDAVEERQYCFGDDACR